MKRCLFIKLAILVSLALLVSCSSSYRLLSRTSVTEAGTLKNYCEQNNLQAPEITKADSLFADANGQLQKGGTEEGYNEMDLAVLYYRIALAKRELSNSQKRLEDVEKRLNDDENQLATYKEVLKEMKEATR